MKQHLTIGENTYAIHALFTIYERIIFEYCLCRLGRQKVAQTFLSAHHYAYDPITLALASETIVDLQTGASNVITRSTGALGRPAGIALSDSPYAISYTYDAYGRFHSVSSSVQSAQSVAIYSYLPNSDLVAGMTASSGFLWTRAYESSRSLITSVENRFGETVISRYDYTNDELGRRTSRADSGLAFAAQPTYGDTATVGMPAYNAYSYTLASHRRLEMDTPPPFPP